MKCSKCGYPLHIENGKCRTCRQPVTRGSQVTKGVNVVECSQCGSSRVRYCSKSNAIICMNCDHRWKPY